jgi:hypothetical protein
MEPTIALLTCTGGRPDSFRLAERWVANQTRHPDQWVVVDDVEEPTELTMGQTLVRPEPFWDPDGGPTLARNMLAGLKVVDADIIVVLEDDDYYGPEWLDTVATWLTHSLTCLVGESKTIYYHVTSRRHHRHGNTTHASLCATAFKRHLVKPICNIINKVAPSPFIDHQIWARLEGQLYDTHHVVGMKGLAGRPGAGRGHCDDGYWSNFDFTGDYLRGLIGWDANAYLDFYEGPEPTPTLLSLVRRLGPSAAMADNEKQRIMQQLDDETQRLLEGIL